MASELSTELIERLRRVKLFLCDVDGVLTDATVWLASGQPEAKRFNIQDGLGLVSLREQGVQVGWISSRPSEATAARAAELKIDYLEQRKASKTTVIEDVLRTAGKTWDQVCYAGDDIVDLGPMTRAGVAIAVANATAEVKNVAHYTTQVPGGSGAVREICELILKAQSKWDAVVEKYRNP